MAEWSTEVDTAHLHAGADRCREAAGMAPAGAGNLAEKVPAAGMFGDLAGASAVHQAFSVAHWDHVERLHGHHRALTDIGNKTHSAASEFTAQDAAAADTLRDAEAGFGMA